MRITQSLYGEHGAINALLDFIEDRAPGASAQQLGLLAEFSVPSYSATPPSKTTCSFPKSVPFLPPPPGGPDAPTDHEVIAGLLRKIEQTGDSVTRRRLLFQTVEETRRHFAKEETKIFPIAERKLPAQTQRDLAGEWAVRRAVSIESRLRVQAGPSSG